MGSRVVTSGVVRPPRLSPGNVRTDGRSEHAEPDRDEDTGATNRASRKDRDLGCRWRARSPSRSCSSASGRRLPSDGARIAFYGDGWSDVGVRIDPIDAPAAGLQAGDLVVGVAGRSVDAWLGATTDGAVARPVGASRSRMRWSVTGAPAPPASCGPRRRSGRRCSRAGACSSSPWPSPRSPPSSSPCVRTSRPPPPSDRGAAAAAGSSVPWFLGATVSDIVQGGPFLLHTLVTGPIYMLLWPAGLHLALVFPRPSPIVARRRWLIPAVYAVCLGGYGLAMLAGRMTTSTDLGWVGTWPIAQVAVVVPALVVTLRRLRPDLPSHDRPGGTGQDPLGLAWRPRRHRDRAVRYMLPELVLHRPLLPASWIGSDRPAAPARPGGRDPAATTSSTSMSSSVERSSTAG